MTMMPLMRICCVIFRCFILNPSLIPLTISKLSSLVSGEKGRGDNGIPLINSGAQKEEVRMMASHAAYDDCCCCIVCPKSMVSHIALHAKDGNEEGEKRVEKGRRWFLQGLLLGASISLDSLPLSVNHEK